MKASSNKASPSTLSATCNTNQMLRAAIASALGVRPLRSARPTSPVADGAAKKDTADPRSRRSLASCSRTRHSASIESAGPRPTSVSWEIATTCTAAPAEGNAITKARRDREGGDAEGDARRPVKGANTSAVANPYSAKTIRCRVTITANTGRAHAQGPGSPLGWHLLDQSYR